MPSPLVLAQWPDHPKDGDGDGIVVWEERPVVAKWMGHVN
jgi:hypothetical protein